MVVSVDAGRQISTTHIRFREVKASEVIREEIHVMKMRLFFKEEIRSLLEQAGFWSVEGIAAPGIDSQTDLRAWEPIVTATKPQTRL